MRKFITVLILLFLLQTIALSTIQAQSEERLVIATTATHVADLARVIAGETADIINIISPGLDPHDYRFTERDSTSLRQADIILYSGLGFEGYVEVTLEDFERQKPVHGVLNVVGEQGLGLMSDEGIINSHAWHDPRNWILATQSLADFLSQYDPDNAALYQANAEEYVAQLEILIEWARESMSLVPEESRVIVSAHGAFAYFGYAYDWQLVSVQGINTADEAGIGEIQAVVDFVVSNQILAIYTESSLPADTIEAVVASAQNQGWDVNIGGELLGDSFTEPGTFTGTYIGMIHYNIHLIVSANGYGDEIPPFPDELPQPEDYESDT